MPDERWDLGEDAAWVSDLLAELPYDERDWPQPWEGWPDDIRSPIASSLMGTFFDDTLDFREPEGAAFTLAVLSKLASAENRKKKRSAAEQERHRTLVRKILANGVRCAFHRDPPRVAYFRKADKYRGKAPWCSGRAMARVTTLLQQADLVTLTLGSFRQGAGTASSYTCTDTLLEIAKECDIVPGSLITRIPKERLVRLRKRGRKGGHIDVAPFAQVSASIDRLHAWNDFASQQDIAVSLSADDLQQWVEELTDSPVRTGMPFRRPELFRTSLYRSFVDDFDQHGRLYGGWWITAPETIRKKITINSETTVELDFSGCSIGMLYSEIGEVAPDDPYELNPVTAYAKENGLDPCIFRDTHKALLNALLNCGQRGRPANVIRKHRLPIPPIYKPRDIVRMLEKKHQAISSVFRSGVGLRLHYEDSELALQIISRLSADGILALPVHDSFITPKANGDALRKAMVDCYQGRFGTVPAISTK